jgi:hypothetical protein
MKALISPSQQFELRWITGWTQNAQEWVPTYSVIEDCQRVAEVSSAPFDVASPLYWIDCPDDCAADQWYLKNGSLYPKPQNVDKPE